MKKILKNNKFNGIIIAIAFIFNILVFAPIEMFEANKKDFWFELNNILIIILPISIILMIVLGFILVKLNKKEKIIPQRIICTLLTCLYIQGNFLNFGYSVLDGSEIEWYRYIPKGLINTALWLFLMIFPYEIKTVKKKKNFRIYTSTISLFILLIEIITLITLGVTSKPTKRIGKELSNQNALNLSKNQNIVVLMSDTFEATYMNKILEEYPEYKEKLEDFTYFNNATAVSFFTYSSVPTLLTGVPCEVGNTLDENIDYCFNNTELYKILKDNNFSTEVYTEKALIPYREEIDNLTSKKTIVKLKSNLEINKNMYKLVLYRYLPHFLKKPFAIDSDTFQRIKANNNDRLCYTDESYSLDDVKFNNAVINEGISNTSNKNTFKFFQLDGAHKPYQTTVDLQYDYSEEYFSYPKEYRKYNEAIASVKLLCNYVEALKKAGVYDNTTIIFVADHGYDNRFYVNLLVKKAHDKHKFKVSSAPVSTLTDLTPTILNIATNSKEYGKDFFDYKENEERTRQVFDYTYQADSFRLNNYYVISKMIFETNKNANEKDAFLVVDEEYFQDDKLLTSEYEFGNIVNVETMIKSSCMNLKGFALKKVTNSSTIGANINKNTKLIVNRKKADKDVKAEIVVDKIYGNKQTAIFKINGNVIHKEDLTAKNGQTISFTIPKDLWNTNELFEMEMEFPDAILGEEEFTMMMAVKLKNIKFQN